MESIHNIKQRYRAKSMRDVVSRLERLVAKKNEELARLQSRLTVTNQLHKRYRNALQISGEEL